MNEILSFIQTLARSSLPQRGFQEILGELVPPLEILEPLAFAAVLLIGKTTNSLIKRPRIAPKSNRAEGTETLDSLAYLGRQRAIGKDHDGRVRRLCRSLRYRAGTMEQLAILVLPRIPRTGNGIRIVSVWRLHELIEEIW